ncbi:MAG: hypothetical protein F6K24_18355 [Okeania sp. SIO2D1]|nr:hypothetical protein [Okeania sp. SIO2D1]
MLTTQDKFINILSIDVLELEDLFTIVNSSALSGNLFVKHLVIMADFGGEMLKRISREFKSLFPNEERNITGKVVSEFINFKPYLQKLEVIKLLKLMEKTFL